MLSFLSITDRHALKSDSSSNASENVGDSGYLERLATAFGQVDTQILASPAPQVARPDDKDGVDFCLFSGGRAQKVRFQSPERVPRDSGFLFPSRPHEYYFSAEATDQRLQQYRAAAVTGDDIRRGLDHHWKGCELPWRVTIIKLPAQAIPKQEPPTSTPGSQVGRRCRKGKKTRIAIRKRLAADKLKILERERRQAEKESMEKDKRIARNREKKAKRRQKQRDAKAALTDDG